MAEGVSLATAYYQLVPSMGGNQSQITKGFTGVGSDASKGFGKSFIGGVGKLAGPLAAAFAGVKVGQFLGDAVEEAREAQKVGALTEQIIKSTGGAAKVSANDVGNLATAISNKAGMDDEAIQSGANLLLTFKNVRNEAGKGSKIFDRATSAAVDLSAAGFGSVESTSKQLGKALNDPIKGMSMLGRAGVTFTDDQQKLVKGMVEQGDLLGAQKLMLKEVESQVGGAAAASATAGDKLSVSWGNFKETIGTALLPVLDRVMNFISGTVLPGILSLGTKMGPIVDKIKSFFSSLGSGASTEGGKFSAFVDTIKSVLGSLKSIFTSAVSIITSLWSAFGPTIIKGIVPFLSGMLTTVRGVFTVLRGIFQTVAALLKGDWKGAWEGIKTILSGAWTVIKGVVKTGWAVIKTLFSAAKVILKAAAGAIWDGVKAAFSAGISTSVKLVEGLKSKAIGALKGAATWLVSTGADIVRGLISGIGSIAGDVTTALLNLLPAPLRKFAKKLGIASPSKLMRDEYGRWIPAGLAAGIDKGAPAVTSSMNALANGVISSGVPNLGSPILGDPLSASGAAAGASLTEAGMERAFVRAMGKSSFRLISDGGRGFRLQALNA